MARKLKPDNLLFLTTLVLVGVGVVMVYSASVGLASERAGQWNIFLLKQAVGAVAGVCGLLVLMRVDYRHYRKPVVIWTALIGVIVLLVAVFFSRPVNGARRWLFFGDVGIQPSELAKLAVILFSAAILERRMDRINEDGYALTPIAIVVAAVGGLILVEPDFGTAMAVGLIAGVMVFAAGLRFRYLLASVLVVLPALVAIIVNSPERLARALSFLFPEKDPLGDGYQLIQSLIAVGTGGVWGTGLMEGVQKLYFLPEPHTDFIYAVVAEETGLLGTTAVLLCFCVIAWRGCRIALRAPDRFGAFLAVGLTTMVVLQAFININIVLGLLPTTGIPLPFVSAGGSSLLTSLVGMGVLLNVSQHALAEP